MQVFAQDTVGPYIFTPEITLKTTPVKDQNITGTCWSFATVSFLETEAIRLGKSAFDLSEMYFIRQVYSEKAERYIRFHGNITFGQGGQAHDVLDVMRKSGIVPEEVYPGLNYGEKKHNHAELEAVLKGFLNGVKQNSGEKLTTAWKDAYEAILDTYLGKIPTEFQVNNKTFSPKDFVRELGLNPDDYIELTSYSHHPFYS
jgi:bleomycin hydrolase